MTLREYLMRCFWALVQTDESEDTPSDSKANGYANNMNIPPTNVMVKNTTAITPSREGGSVDKANTTNRNAESETRLDVNTISKYNLILLVALGFVLALPLAFSLTTKPMKDNIEIIMLITSLMSIITASFLVREIVGGIFMLFNHEGNLKLTIKH